MALTPSASAVSFSARPSVRTTTFRPRASADAKRVRAGAPNGGKWWAPLVGWSGRADYLEAATPAMAPVVAEEEEDKAGRSFVGRLTEEKARQLRARMAEMESFHDAMYHSAIASRLARTA
ncbi:uncharacterized protein LOC124648884 [Lolium rigidum]|uniref:uncharacterized protein LOC124648884 n=1 Tax=Lolium rigidum TaxID=89674 RepID=UPI001F5C2546|nr:uncharacterized protein LOC124648884 [Lolium rigidum]